MVNERELQAERRRGRRTGLRRPCMLHLSGAEQRQGMTVDVGVDGLSLYTDKPVAAGTRCEVQFELPGTESAQALRVAAKVVYSSYTGPQGFKIGAIFVALDARATEALLAFSGG
ncbi:MAG: PilZ domain-containing protein [Burkholderiaceae bacterium]